MLGGYVLNVLYKMGTDSESNEFNKHVPIIPNAIRILYVQSVSYPNPFRILSEPAIRTILAIFLNCLKFSNFPSLMLRMSPFGAE